ncbi:MAG TPA: hypothetical protein VFA12_20150 [Stellaceae bacterium]|nr:hypothetical protein [Stellaceae bacterium]
MIYPVKKLVALTTEQAKAIEDFRFAHRIPTEAEAIRQLIERGLSRDEIPVHRPKPRGKASE